jgi:hypothetical protein
MKLRRTRLGVGVLQLLSATFAMMAVGRLALAQDGVPPGEFSLGIGYAHISIGDSGSSVLDSEDALRFDGVLSYAPFPQVSQLRLGAAVGVSLVLDDSERVITSSGGLVIAGSSEVPVYLVEPEFRASWQQFFGQGQHFYVEPGIGVGGVIGNVSLDADDTASGDSFDESDAALSARVFLNVGFRAEGGFAGLQASYMRGGSLDFAENARGEVEELYVGFFGCLRF